MKDYDLVSGYKVQWGLSSSSEHESPNLEREMQTYTGNRGLTAGQQYTLNVISIVDLTNPSDNFSVGSEGKVRIGMLYSRLDFALLN